MEFSSSHQVPLSSDQLWQAITDPEVLRSCLRSCYEVRKSGDGEYSALFNIKLGPTKRHFSARLKILDSKAIENYRLVVSLDSDLDARAEAVADVKLESMADNNTRIHYSAEALVHGWLAHILPALALKHFAKKQIGLFFNRVAENVNGE